MRVLFFLSFVTFCFANEYPDLETGWYGGIGSGYKRTKMKYGGGPTFGGTERTISVSSDRNVTPLEVHYGKDMMRGKYYWALQGEFRLDHRQQKTEVDPITGYNTNNIRFYLDHTYDLGVSARAGYQLYNFLAAYFILSGRLAHFKVEANAGNDKKSRSKNAIGFGGGIGIRRALPEQYSLAIETTYDIYEGVKNFSFNTPSVAANTSFRAEAKKPKIFAVLLKVQKMF